MSDKELKELDAWIAEHVMGWKESPNAEHVWRDGNRLELNWHPTTDGRCAFAVLKKCCDVMAVNVETWKGGDKKWYARALTGDYGQADTLELAICLFAKELFSKAS